MSDVGLICFAAVQYMFLGSGAQWKVTHGSTRSAQGEQTTWSDSAGKIVKKYLSNNIEFCCNAEFKYLLQGTQTDYKNELLFTEFGINYASLPVMFRKVRGLKCN